MRIRATLPWTRSRSSAALTATVDVHLTSPSLWTACHVATTTTESFLVAADGHEMARRLLQPLGDPHFLSIHHGEDGCIESTAMYVERLL